jgi:hypothetical protein
MSVRGHCHMNLFWQRESPKSLGSSSGRRCGSPRLERFASENAERVAGCEMTLDVENVVDGGVNEEDALG